MLCLPCRSVTLLEFTKFVHKLGFLLHMDTLALAEMLLQVARDSESVQPSADDTAVLSSMQKADCTAKVHSCLPLLQPCGQSESL